MTIKEFETYLNETLKGQPTIFSTIENCVLNYLNDNFANGEKVHCTSYGKNKTDIYFVNDESYRIDLATITYHLTRVPHKFKSLEIKVNKNMPYETIEDILNYAENYKKGN